MVVIMVSGLRIPNCVSCELQEVDSSQLLQQFLLRGVRKEDHRLSSTHPQTPLLLQVRPPRVAMCHCAPRATQPLKECRLLCEKQVEECPARHAHCMPQTVLRAH